ncbi:GDP-mannose 4,6-dehydratase [Pseudomonas alcaligenes]|uniref:GDP-mannose 4,6-dehydratase n=1 Tax=Aquipseudomonas alcaligenes TaxID=43263 RepID=UPI00358F7655
MKRLLATGLSGFVGRHLSHCLNSGDTGWQLIAPQPHDLLEPATLDCWLAEDCPDAVIHLAGQALVPEAFRDPQRTLQVNVLGTLNLLQALKRRGFSGAFLYVSSGDVYGQVAEQVLPITEECVAHPRNPYAVSKLSGELLCEQWSYCESWRIMAARPFNHIGPGQAAGFVVPGVARQLAEIRIGLREAVLNVGDIDVTRDFLDVQDVISAYLAMLEHGRSGQIYNVCSGVERSVRGMIELMVEMSGLQVEIRQDPTSFRKAEQRRVVGCANKLNKETGWKPGISITETLQSVMSDWEARVVEK